MPKLNFEAIGTTWQITHESSRSMAKVSLAVHELIETFDHSYSRFRPDSFVRSIAQAPGMFILSDDAEPMMRFYKLLYEATQGRVTPLIGQLMADSGYDETYSLQPGILSSVPAWENVLTYRHPVLQTHQPVTFDFGAAGKGYLVDLVADLFRQMDVFPFVINAGGDIYSDSAVGVALEDPSDTSQAIGVATIQHQAICGSAGNRRKWANFTHIIDPVTKRSPTNIAATWVVADTTMLADGLSTALFFTDALTLQQHFVFEYAIVSKDGGLYSSAGFPADFYITQQEEDYEQVDLIYR